MNNIIEYKTVRAGSADVLDQRVNALIQEGYVLYGSPYGLTDGKSYYYCQALVKQGVTNVGALGE